MANHILVNYYREMDLIQKYVTDFLLQAIFINLFHKYRNFCLSNHGIPIDIYIDGSLTSYKIDTNQDQSVMGKGWHSKVEKDISFIGRSYNWASSTHAELLAIQIALF